MHRLNNTEWQYMKTRKGSDTIFLNGMMKIMRYFSQNCRPSDQEINTGSPEYQKDLPINLNHGLVIKHNTWVTGWTTKESEFKSQWGQEFLFLHVVHTGSGTNPASYPVGTGGDRGMKPITHLRGQENIHSPIVYLHCIVLNYISTRVTSPYLLLGWL
jgi:hypothetical protein